MRGCWRAAKSSLAQKVHWGHERSRAQGVEAGAEAAAGQSVPDDSAGIALTRSTQFMTDWVKQPCSPSGENVNQGMTNDHEVILGNDQPRTCWPPIEESTSVAARSLCTL